MVRHVSAMGLALGLVACGSGGDGGGESSGTGGSGGMPGCSDAEMQLVDGSCVPVGVPLDGCDEGFEHDGDFGCAAVLPPDPCPSGLMATPGETQCRPVAPCGDGPWGDIPVDASTQHVDPAFAGLSDGSAANPWKTVDEAIAAAAPGGIVALTDGSYGDIVIQNKPVRLWGRCPELVEVSGSAFSLATMQVLAGAAGTEIHQLAIRSDSVGLAISGSQDVVVDRLWIHDGGARGLAIEGGLGPTSVTISNTLIERNVEVGMALVGVEVSLTRSVVRGTQATVSGFGGRGIGAQHGPVPNSGSTLVIAGVVVEGNVEMGIGVSGSVVTVDGSVIRDIQLDAQMGMGRGISVQEDADLGQPSTVAIRGSVVERTHQIAVAAFGSELALERTVLRNTMLDGDGRSGRGINVQSNAQGLSSFATVARSLISASVEHGAMVLDSTLTIDASVVRDSVPNATGGYGDGLSAIPDFGIPTSLVVTNSLIANSARAGASTFDASLSIGSSTFRCQPIDLNQESLGVLDPVVEDLGNNGCGCDGALGDCKLLSSGLTPPTPVAE